MTCEASTDDDSCGSSGGDNISDGGGGGGAVFLLTFRFPDIASAQLNCADHTCILSFIHF